MGNQWLEQELYTYTTAAHGIEFVVTSSTPWTIEDVMALYYMFYTCILPIPYPPK